MSFVPYFKSQDIENIYMSPDGEMIIVEGIAADTSRDIVGDMASKNFIKKLASDLKGRAVYYNHNYKMPQIGVVLDTKTLDNDNRLWARAGVYVTKTNENIIKGLRDGSMRFFSVGAVGQKVVQGLFNTMPTRIFDDGYGQELTITGVPINPTAAFKVAKSHGSDSDGYNTQEEFQDFVKAVAETFRDENGNPIDILEERNRIAQDMEEFFMKGNGGMINPEYWEGAGKTSGQWDNLNPPAAKRPGMSDLRPEGGQLAPQTLEGIIRKCMAESANLGDFVERVAYVVRKSQAEEDYNRGFGYDHLNGTGRGPSQMNSWGPGGEGVLAKVIAQEIINIAGKSNSAPNYGTHPWDAEVLRNGMPKVNFTERGYDDTFVSDAVSKAGPESLGPVGQGKNPGVHPMDQVYLQQGLQQLPPALKSNGYVHANMTNIQKAEDLLEDPAFMDRIHATRYLYRRGIGDNETSIEYIHRLLHERGQTMPGDPFRKAIDDSIIYSMNTYDWDNMSIEDQAIVEHITRDFAHSDVFNKCLDNPASIFSGVDEEEESFEKGGMPPWLEKGKDEKKGKKSEDDEDDEDEEEDDDKDEKDEKKGKKKEFPPKKKFVKKDEKDDDDEDEDEDEDEDKDEKEVKKSHSDDDDELDEESQEILKSFFDAKMRDRIMKEQDEALAYTKGLTSNPVSQAPTEVGGIERFANDNFERGVLAAIVNGKVS